VLGVHHWLHSLQAAECPVFEFIHFVGRHDAALHEYRQRKHFAGVLHVFVHVEDCRLLVRLVLAVDCDHVRNLTLLSEQREYVEEPFVSEHAGGLLEVNQEAVEVGLVQECLEFGLGVVLAPPDRAVEQDAPHGDQQALAQQVEEVEHSVQQARLGGQLHAQHSELDEVDCLQDQRQPELHPKCHHYFEDPPQLQIHEYHPHAQFLCIRTLAGLKDSRRRNTNELSDALVLSIYKSYGHNRECQVY